MIKKTPVFERYIEKINELYVDDKFKEHTYRRNLQDFIEGICSLLVLNDEARVRNSVTNRQPDLIVYHRDTNNEVGYIETKTIKIDLEDVLHTDQITECIEGFDSFVLTNYLDFIFYRRGHVFHRLNIGKIVNGKVILNYDEIDIFILLVSDQFGDYQTVSDLQKLLNILVSKAKLLRSKTLETLKETDTLTPIYSFFEKHIIEGINNVQFANLYAQTIVYGLFIARYHSKHNSFNLEIARESISNSSIFFEGLFKYIMSDETLIQQNIIKSVLNVLENSNVKELLADSKDFRKDNFILLYENFLQRYDSTERKNLGVWYTPKEIVLYMVKTVDKILKEDFGIPTGIVDIDANYNDNKVEILDPAVGTGTFLLEIIKYVKNSKVIRKLGSGIWHEYLNKNLLSRVYGFEKSMVSYLLAHHQITNILGGGKNNAKIYLTDSLKKEKSSGIISIHKWLNDEIEYANNIKRSNKIMCVIGNPPYQGKYKKEVDDSWIYDLLKKNYFSFIGNEKQVGALYDKYILFILLGQNLIRRSTTSNEDRGILAYITNNSFLEGPTHRGMRWKLLKTFNKIYIFNLHGNSGLKHPDENVFKVKSIGVSITIFIRTGKPIEKLGNVYYKELFGEREFKLEYLSNKDFDPCQFQEIEPSENMFYFVPDNIENSNYLDNGKGFGIEELFDVNRGGIMTANDKLTVHFTKDSLNKIIDDFINLDVNELQEMYEKTNTNKKIESSNWTFKKAKESLKRQSTNVRKFMHRPFDFRYTLYDSKSGFLARPSFAVMKHLLVEGNIALLLKHQSKFDFTYAFITDTICGCQVFETLKARVQVFPLYRLSLFEESKLEPNFNFKIIKNVENSLSINFVAGKENSKTQNQFTSIDVFDYIYAILHVPNYRTKYGVYLRRDFPKIPYPKNLNKFWNLVKQGQKLRNLHLLKSNKNTVFSFESINKKNSSKKLKHKITKKNGYSPINADFGRVYINDFQYFDNIPKDAYNFVIGNNKPAIRYLQEREGRCLDISEIFHYQKLIFALYETNKIVEELKNVEIDF